MPVTRWPHGLCACQLQDGHTVPAHASYRMATQSLRMPVTGFMGALHLSTDFTCLPSPLSPGQLPWWRLEVITAVLVSCLPSLQQLSAGTEKFSINTYSDVINVLTKSMNNGESGIVVVQALCHKPEGRGFESQWGNFFLIYLILPAAPRPGIYSASNTNEYQ
jgi:hypothetical protein